MISQPQYQVYWLQEVERPDRLLDWETENCWLTAKNTNLNAWLKVVEAEGVWWKADIAGRVWKPWPRRATAPKSAAPEIYFFFLEALRGVIPYSTPNEYLLYFIYIWFRCRHPVSRPVTVVSWRRPTWIPGYSTKQSAWRRTWRNYWFTGDGMFYCDTVSVCVRARNTVSVNVRARNLWFTVYLRHFCAW